MAEPDVTANGAPARPPSPPRPPRRRIPGFLLFGIVAATIEMAIVLWLLYG